MLAETPLKGWGLKAERDFEVGETIAVVPRSMCIGLPQQGLDNERNADRDSAWTGPTCIQALIDQVPQEFADLRLGLVLLHERFKTGSKWEPYIQNLPSSFKGVPLTSFSAADIKALQDSELNEKIDDRCKFLVSFMKDVLDHLSTGPDAPFGEQRLTFSDLAWATAAVSSRAFVDLCGPGRDESKPLLVPFFDMLNFNFEKSNAKVISAWLQEHEEGDDGNYEGVTAEQLEVRLIATRPVEAGESLEIRDNSPNVERLCKYGFVDVERQNECNTFTFEKNMLKAARMAAGIMDEPFGARFETDALEPWQQRVLREVQLDGSDIDLNLHLGGDSTRGRLPVDGRLLAALRVMFSRSKKELEGKTAKELCSYKEGRLSKYVEQRMLATVIGLGIVYTKEFSTTIEQDEMALYGRCVSPTEYEARRSPPPWQVLDEEGIPVRDMRIQRFLARMKARSQDAASEGQHGETEEDGQGEEAGQEEEEGIQEDGEGDHDELEEQHNTYCNEKEKYHEGEEKDGDETEEDREEEGENKGNDDEEEGGDYTDEEEDENETEGEDDNEGEDGHDEGEREDEGEYDYEEEGEDEEDGDEEEDGDYTKEEEDESDFEEEEDYDEGEDDDDDEERDDDYVEEEEDEEDDEEERGDDYQEEGEDGEEEEEDDDEEEEEYDDDEDYDDEESDDDDNNDDDDNGEEEDDGDEEDEDGEFDETEFYYKEIDDTEDVDEGQGDDARPLEVNPQLKFEMVQAIKYRLAKKRTLQDVKLIARSELRRVDSAE